MGGGAAGGERKHGLAVESVLRQQVEERLEETRVRGLVDGSRDDDAVGAGEELDRLDDGGVGEVGAEERLGGQGADVEGYDVVALRFEPRVEMAQEPRRAGGGGGTSGNGEDGGHDGTLRAGIRHAECRN